MWPTCNVTSLRIQSTFYVDHANNLQIDHSLSLFLSFSDCQSDRFTFSCCKNHDYLRYLRVFFFFFWFILYEIHLSRMLNSQIAVKRIITLLLSAFSKNPCLPPHFYFIVNCFVALCSSGYHLLNRMNRTDGTMNYEKLPNI